MAGALCFLPPSLHRESISLPMWSKCFSTCRAQLFSFGSADAHLPATLPTHKQSSIEQVWCHPLMAKRSPHCMSYTSISNALMATLVCVCKLRPWMWFVLKRNKIFLLIRDEPKLVFIFPSPQCIPNYHSAYIYIFHIRTYTVQVRKLP